MSLHAWHVFWLCWFTVSFGTFLGFETYGLITDARRTLSAAVWHMEKFQPGQPITAWTALHLMFVGALIVVFGWLIGHFGWMIWR